MDKPIIKSFTVRPNLPHHYLYLVVRRNRQYRLQTQFRDILRADGHAREEYAQLNGNLAPLLEPDRAAYTEGKTELIGSLLRRHGFSPTSDAR